MDNYDFGIALDYDPIVDNTNDEKAKIVAKMLEAHNYYVNGNVDRFLETIDIINNNDEINENNG